MVDGGFRFSPSKYTEIQGSCPQIKTLFSMGLWICRRRMIVKEYPFLWYMLTHECHYENTCKIKWCGANGNLEEYHFNILRLLWGSRAHGEHNESDHQGHTKPGGHIKNRVNILLTWKLNKPINVQKRKFCVCTTYYWSQYHGHKDISHEELHTSILHQI